ncbi:hypothetical protein [Kosakonia sp. R1.Fl]|uniref:hypothetical protein n=1 Tax=Kosakonia sp. R1.Fl TaxID=2928706 RepID=UPI00201D513E|nr:hypothetical protein [Kosakonia sp. R1.Fl]MCL6742441.1 hypothetical protein [Kosakonia sp. R1.Fl]
MNKKYWIRWASIALICTAYYVIVLYFDLVFAVNFSETLSQGWDFTPSQLTCFVMELSQNHDDSALASIVGFAICVPLIRLIFKKVSPMLVAEMTVVFKEQYPNSGHLQP